MYYFYIYVFFIGFDGVVRVDIVGGVYFNGFMDFVIDIFGFWLFEDLRMRVML